MQVLPEFIFIAQVQKKSNSSKFFQESIAIFYDLQKENNRETRKETSRTSLEVSSSYSLPFAAVIHGGGSFEALLLGSSLPCLSISPVLMRVEEILEPSSAFTSSTVIIFAGLTPILVRISLSSLPLLWVSVLVTSASTLSVVTAGPKSPSSFAIS